MHSMMIVLTAVMVAAAGQRPVVPGSSSSQVEHLTGSLVTLIDEAEVPAEESGKLVDLLVKEGQQVAQGDLLAQIDDQLPQTAQKVAQGRLDVARKEASNDINVRYAVANHAVADAEFNQSEAVNEMHPGTVTKSELRRQFLQKEQAKLQIEQARHELAIATVTVDVRSAELEAARQDVERRKIRAPLDGLVIKRYLHKGEFARPGDPVLHLVRVDRLRIEGYLNAMRLSSFEVQGRPITAMVELARGRQETFEGKIVFASPIIEAGNKFLVKAEVINRQDRNGHWLLSPGSTVDMTIHLQ